MRYNDRGPGSDDQEKMRAFLLGALREAVSWMLDKIDDEVAFFEDALAGPYAIGWNSWHVYVVQADAAAYVNAYADSSWDGDPIDYVGAVILTPSMVQTLMGIAGAGIPPLMRLALADISLKEALAKRISGEGWLRRPE